MPRTKFSPELTDRLVELVRAGNYVETAAKAAGIHKATYYSWVTRGEKAAELSAKATPSTTRKPRLLTSSTRSAKPRRSPKLTRSPRYAPPIRVGRRT